MQTEDFLTYSVPRLIGQVADTSLAQIDSYVAENAIGFGEAVKRGTDSAKQVKKLDNITDFLGIAVRNERQTTGDYPANNMVSVLTFGRVVVKTGEAVVAGDKAYIHADGTFNKTAADGALIGIFMSNQPTVDNLVIMQIGKE